MATSTPARRPAVAARREAIEELGLDVEHPADGPQLLHLDVHDAALGHVHLDLRYLLIAGDDDPHPPPGESPDARWCSWEEAMAMADAALVDALPLARAAYRRTGGGHDRQPDAPARGAGPRHVDHPDGTPPGGAARDERPGRRRVRARRPQDRAGRGREHAGRHWRLPSPSSRCRSPPSPSDATTWKSASMPRPARRGATCRP